MQHQTDNRQLMMWKDSVRVPDTLDDPELMLTLEPSAVPDNEDCGCILGIGHDPAKRIGVKRALVCLELALYYHTPGICAFSRFISAESKNEHCYCLEFIRGDE